jgi:hypothetical protein
MKGGGTVRAGGDGRIARGLRTLARCNHQTGSLDDPQQICPVGTYRPIMFRNVTTSSTSCLLLLAYLLPPPPSSPAPIIVSPVAVVSRCRSHCPIEARCPTSLILARPFLTSLCSERPLFVMPIQLSLISSQLPSDVRMPAPSYM